MMPQEDNGAQPVTHGAGLGDTLSSISNLLKLIGAVATAVIPILLPHRLVPEQLEPIRVSATLLALLFILLGLYYRHVVRRHLGRLIVAAVVTAVTLVALNIAFVIPLRLGNPPEIRYFLLGFAYSEDGARLLEKAGVQRENRERQWLEVGYDNISRVYGPSYAATAALYSFTTIAMFGCTVLALVGTVQPGHTSAP